MKTLRVFLIILFVLLTATGFAFSQMYKWVDEDGKVHFSDSPPPNVESVREIQSIRTQKGSSQSVMPAKRDTGKIMRNKYPVRESSDKTKTRKAPVVELYTTSWCPYCDMARDFFRSRGIPFTEYDIEKDRSAALRKSQLDRGRGVPFVVINGHGISGFSKEAYEKALLRKQ